MLSQPDKVKVKITGKIIDEIYTKLLIKNTQLDMKTVMYLDKVQKKEKLSFANTPGVLIFTLM